VAMLFHRVAWQATLLESRRPQVCAGSCGKPLSELCCPGCGSLGTPLDPGAYIVLPSPDAHGEALVDNEKAGLGGIPSLAGGVINGSSLDWTRILAMEPCLEAPGYKEAVAAAITAREERARAAMEAVAEKKAAKKPAKRKSRRR
jgi:hypothetical protein